MRRILVSLVMAVALLAGPATGAFAATPDESCLAWAAELTPEIQDSRDFLLFNCTTDLNIVFAFVSPSDTADWGEDILGKEWLAPSEYWEVAFNTRYDGVTCLWDIKIVTLEGGEGVLLGVDLCSTNRVTIS
jgi:hypothetical protein